MALGSTNACGGGGSGKSEIIVKAPTGSTVTVSCAGIVKRAVEKAGTWVFRGCGVGTWLITIAKDGETATGTVEIAEAGQLMRYYIAIDFYLYPDDFDFSRFGVKGTDYEVVLDSGAVIPVGDYRKYKNWEIHFLTSGNGDIRSLKNADIEAFVLGAGAGGNAGGTFTDGGNGGGGFYKVQTAHLLAAANYPITIGAAGMGGYIAGATLHESTPGGNTSAFGITANGGKTGTPGSLPSGGGVHGSGGSPTGKFGTAGTTYSGTAANPTGNTGKGGLGGAKNASGTSGVDGSNGLIIIRPVKEAS